MDRLRYDQSAFRAQLTLRPDVSQEVGELSELMPEAIGREEGRSPPFVTQAAVYSHNILKNNAMRRIKQRLDTFVV